MASLLNQLNRGVALLNRNQPESAAALLRAVLRQSPEHPDGLHLLAVAHFQMGELEQARQYGERAFQLNPRSADSASNLGRYYVGLKLWPEAIATLNEALRLNPAHALARFNLGCALADAGQKREAAEELERYVALAPSDAGGFHRLGEIYAELPQPAQAERCFRRVIELNPALPESHNNLGNALQAMGRHGEAIDCYRRSLALKPGYADAFSNLGAALQESGRLEEAGECYRRALELEPGLLSARGNMGNLLSTRGEYAEALAVFEEILRERPGSIETWNNAGNAYQQLGRFEEAIAAYGRALDLNPGYYVVFNNIGNTLRRQGRYEEAVVHYRKALEADPNFAEALNNLAVALADLGRPAEAVEHFEKALAARPDYVDPLINLSNYWRERSRPQKAIDVLENACLLQPGNAFAWNNLGCALGDTGRVAEGIECFRKTLALRPASWQAHSNILLNLHYTAGLTPEQIFEEHKAFGRAHGAALAGLRKPFANRRDPERRLRVGYVSADFKRHSVAFFLEPVLEHHRRMDFEIYCYSDVARPDGYTARFRSLAGAGWRDTLGMNHERFAARVREDEIDILVETGGHTANSRLLSLAARPAPVQVSWLGYPNSTGLDAIDYRLTDALADPAGRADALYTERLVRLDGGFLCFRPSADSPAVEPPPHTRTGAFTFGSFNNMAKISPETVRLWSAILRRTPGARLILKNKALSEPEARQRIAAWFDAEQIGEDRLLLSGTVESLAGHLDSYRHVDLALDTFPYHGTTTTCEALWMGVPVLSLTGLVHVSRVGLSLLSAVGLDADYAAGCGQSYVEAAARIAAEPSALAGLRFALRDRMRRSALMDEKGFTHKLEEAYRTMWRTWCESGASAKETLESRAEAEESAAMAGTGARCGVKQ